MYERFYLKSPNATYYLRGRGYTPEDFEAVVSEVIGTDMKNFFQHHVRDVTPPPYDEAFGYVGLRLVRIQSREPYNAGISLDWENPQSVLIGSVRNGSVAEQAGLQEGDEIVRVAGKPVTRETWLPTLARF